VAWVIATTPEVPKDKLRLALAAAERASSLEPASTAIRDTLATAHFRADNLERAIRIERDIAALDDTPFFWSQLARFEWAHARRWGPLRLGEESFPMPRIAGGELLHAADEPFEAHFVVLVDDRIVGSLRVVAERQAPSPLTLELPSDLPANARIELTLLDGVRERDPETESHYTPYDAEVATLP